MSFEKVPNFLLNFFDAEMNGNEAHSYRFKSFLLDVAERQLFHDHKPVPLTPKAFDVLVYLVEHGGHLVLKDELMQAVWPDSFVDEVNLPRTVHTIRGTLGEDDNGNKFIETVPTKGYRFVAKVEEVPSTIEFETGRRDFQTDIKVRSETELPVPPTADEETVTRRVADQKHPTRIILFGVGFLTAVFLIVLLSFNFRSVSSLKSHDTRSIAILPLRSIAPDNRDPLYELGIADSLILKLSLVKGLVVRPLSATSQYTDPAQDAVAAGKDQQVDYVLASNYQIADGKIRVASQLINLESGLAEDVFNVEQENSNIFSVQDAVAANIGQSLLKKLGHEPISVLAKHYTSNDAAYRLYLLGTALADRRNGKDARAAVEYFEQAVKLDPNYAPAYAGLANAHSAVGMYGGGNRQEYAKGKTAIETALAIDDNLAEAHSYLGEIKAVYEWDFAGAEREHKRAIELDPNSSHAHLMYALYLYPMGRFDESIDEIKTAIDLQPALVLNQNVYGQILFFAKRYDEAIAQLLRTVEMDPSFNHSYGWLIKSYKMNGESDKAFEWTIRSIERKKDNADNEKLSMLKSLYAMSGWRGIYQQQLEEAKKKEENGEEPYWELSQIYTGLGDREQTILYLEKSFDPNRPDWWWATINVNPRYDSLHSDPRFENIVKRIGLK